MKLNINIELNGEKIRIGSIVGTSSNDACFTYDKNYLDSSDAAPISISLPLREEKYNPSQTRAFFDGLLPEGFTRRNLAGSLHKDADDYLEILQALGKECIGALMISSDEDEPDEKNFGYKKISQKQIKALAAEGASASTKILTKTHLSLAGASGKVGLYQSKEGEWYFPQGMAPSTHIVKQSHVRLGGIVVNELLCIKTAKACGIDTAESTIIDTGGHVDSSILIASKRFDRLINSKAKEKLPVPRRLHQEDFAQALGISSENKYETDGDNYLNKMFELIRTHSVNPVDDQRKLWQRIIFNVLIGNTDGHLKNYALLYSEDLKSIRLAPAYDILSTQLYKESTPRMAFSINGKNNIDEVTRKDLITAGADVGLGRKFAEKIIDEISENFEPALKKAARELKAQGYKDAEKMAKKILEGCSK